MIDCSPLLTPLLPKGRRKSLRSGSRIVQKKPGSCDPGSQPSGGEIRSPGSATPATTHAQRRPPRMPRMRRPVGLPTTASVAAAWAVSSKSAE